MSNPLGSDTELTPEALEVLKSVQEDVRALREIDFEETPPAAIFEAYERMRMQAR